VLKWRDHTEDDTLFEVFLPEHDREGSSARLRAVRRGHIVAERDVSLTWRPTFGPDQGDVEAIEAELDSMIAEITPLGAPDLDGPYDPGPTEIEAPDPFMHAAADFGDRDRLFRLIVTDHFG